MLRRVSLAALALMGVAAMGACTDDDASGPSEATSTTASPSALEAAVEAANVHVAGVGRASVEDLIQELCSGRDADALAAQVVALDVSGSDDLRIVLEGVGHGAERLCPEVAAEDPELINDAHTAALALLAG